AGPPAPAGDRLLGAHRTGGREAARPGDRARRPPRGAGADAGAQPVRRRRPGSAPAAPAPWQAPARLLRRPGRHAPAALRDAGQRPPPDHPRLGLQPREPPARALLARGGAGDHRLRPQARTSRRRRMRRLRSLGYAVGDVFFVIGERLRTAGRYLARVPRALARGCGRFWASLSIIARRRLVAAIGAVVVIIAILALAVPNLPCSFPGGDSCPPPDDA